MNAHALAYRANSCNRVGPVCILISWPVLCGMIGGDGSQILSFLVDKKVFVVLNMGNVLREIIPNGKLKKKIYRILRERTGV